MDGFQLRQDGVSRVLVATGDTLGEGVTLTQASRVIMHDLSWVPSEVLQREARVNRIGQDKPVVSTWPLLRNSFDVLLAQLLRARESLALPPARLPVVTIAATRSSARASAPPGRCRRPLAGRP